MYVLIVSPLIATPFLNQEMVAIGGVEVTAQVKVVGIPAIGVALPVSVTVGGAENSQTRLTSGIGNFINEIGRASCRERC